MDDVLQELGQTPKQLVDELENDLVKLINKHSFMGVSLPSHPCCGVHHTYLHAYKPAMS